VNKNKIAFAIRKPKLMPLEQMSGYNHSLKVKRSNRFIDPGWRMATTLEASNRGVLSSAPAWMDDNGSVFLCVYKEDPLSRLVSTKACLFQEVMELNADFRPTLDLTKEIDVMSKANIKAWEKAWADAMPSAKYVLQKWWSTRPQVNSPHASERKAIAFSVLGVGVHLQWAGGPMQMPSELWEVILSFIQHTHA
jgi:hypothetical protein